MIQVLKFSERTCVLNTLSWWCLASDVKMFFSVETLNKKFSSAWIGRGRQIFRPPRSPDLTPTDFFLWGYVRNIVYGEKIRDLRHLRDMTTAAIATVTPDIIQRTSNIVSISAEQQMEHISKHTKVRRNLRIFRSNLTLESWRYV
jgi:hypothetical protein